MDAEEYRKKIEWDILHIIESKLIAQEMKAPRAKEIANYILASLHPHMPLKEIYKAVLNFDQHFAELVPIVKAVRFDAEQELRDRIAVHAGVLLKKKRTAEAAQLLGAANK